LFIDLLPSHVNDLLKLSEHYRIGRLFWPILSTIRLSDFHTIVLTLFLTDKSYKNTFELLSCKNSLGTLTSRAFPTLVNVSVV